MSRKFRSQASSSRASSGGPAAFGGFGTLGSAGVETPRSVVSYLNEPSGLSGIENPNIVVAFKNLSKKNSTTKAKALEDLQRYLPKSNLEDAVIEAWFTVYPRTSIDTSRKVRQLAHTTHGQVVATAGKKAARYMPRTVGAWIAGLYDNDKLVAKAAQDALEAVFPTEEKLRALRKAYQEPLLDFVQNTIETETPQTLSDERVVSPDEAAAKYARVVAASVGLLSSLLLDLQLEDLKKCQTRYEKLLDNKSLWELAVHADAVIRRATHRLLRTYLQKWAQPSDSLLDTLSSVYIYKGLNSDQSTSAIDYVDALNALTHEYPTVWTDHYRGKKPVKDRLRHFLERGSQGSPSNYWSHVTALLISIPAGPSCADAGEALELLKLFHSAFTAKDEPRLFIGNGFRAYVDLADSLASSLADSGRSTLLESSVLPILRQYVIKDGSQSTWDIPSANARELISQIFNMDGMVQVAASMLPELTDALLSEISSSKPQQSKEYNGSQDKLASEAERYAFLLSRMLKVRQADGVQASVVSSLVQVVSRAADISKSRDGKPYGATSVLTAVATHCSEALDQLQDLGDAVDNFAPELPRLVLSPSTSTLLTLLRLTKDRPAFRKSQISALEIVLRAPDPLHNISIFHKLFTIVASTHPPELERLQPLVSAFVSQCVSEGLKNAGVESQKQASRKAIEKLVSIADVGNLSDDILSALTTHLSLQDDHETAEALEGLQLMFKHFPDIFGAYMSRSDENALMQKILHLTKSPDEEIAQRALSLGVQEGRTGYNILETIPATLNKASPESVTVDSLMDYIANLSKGPKEFLPSDKLLLLPDRAVWKQQLQAFLKHPPPTSFAVTHQLGGLVHLVHDGSAEMTSGQILVDRDADGLSVPVRMVAYTIALLTQVISYHDLDKETCDDLFKLLSLTLALMNDKISFSYSHALWLTTSFEIEQRMSRLYNAGKELLQRWLRDPSWKDNEGNLDISRVRSTFDSWIPADSVGMTYKYYHALIRSEAVSELIDIQGWPNKENAELDTIFRQLIRSPDVIRLCDYVVEHRVPLAKSSTAQRYCNELVADLTAVDMVREYGKHFHKLIVLNIIFQHLEKIETTIAKQRVIFLAQKVITWLADKASSYAIIAESSKLLSVLLTRMSDIYGEHWEEILRFIPRFWKCSPDLMELALRGRLPAIHATLRLYTRIEGLVHGPDPNEDLTETWSENRKVVASGLVHLMEAPRELEDDLHQPLRIVDELVGRCITAVPPSYIHYTSELYSALDSKSPSIQRTAFTLLGAHISTETDIAAVEAIVDKKAARLPDELLSLILAVPEDTVEIEAYFKFKQTLPPRLRGYLLSWLLVFTHFQRSPHKLRIDYGEQIKEGGYMTPLLDFTFQCLGHKDGKPFDASKLNWTSYTIEACESPQEELRTLLTHLYYLSLTHLGSLAKSWWLDCSSRQTYLSVESWTEKHISSQVIKNVLDEAESWAKQQDESDPEVVALQVRASRHLRGGSLHAAYPVDDKFCEIEITLPPTFPLHPASITSISRVAVDDKHWKAWLRRVQGAILFNNNDLVSGLTNFKANVSGALKGLRECAICYSIVAEDGKLPNKTCKTCKNAFHGGCLFQWFKTSNATLCPLCRQAFRYG